MPELSTFVPTTILEDAGIAQNCTIPDGASRATEVFPLSKCVSRFWTMAKPGSQGGGLPGKLFS